MSCVCLPGQALTSTVNHILLCAWPSTCHIASVPSDLSLTLYRKRQVTHYRRMKKDMCLKRAMKYSKNNMVKSSQIHACKRAQGPGQVRDGIRLRPRADGFDRIELHLYVLVIPSGLQKK